MNEITDPEERTRLGFDAGWKVCIDRPEIEEDNRTYRRLIKARRFGLIAAVLRNSPGHVTPETLGVLADFLLTVKPPGKKGRPRVDHRKRLEESAVKKNKIAGTPEEKIKYNQRIRKSRERLKKSEEAFERVLQTSQESSNAFKKGLTL